MPSWPVSNCSACDIVKRFFSKHWARNCWTTGASADTSFPERAGVACQDVQSLQLPIDQLPFELYYSAIWDGGFQLQIFYQMQLSMQTQAWSLGGISDMICSACKACRWEHSQQGLLRRAAAEFDVFVCGSSKTSLMVLLQADLHPLSSQPLVHFDFHTCYTRVM